MTTERKRLFAHLLGAAEEWIYQLNERDHWIFRIYDRGNEFYASLFMRGVRRRASTLDASVTVADGTAVRIRFLTPADEGAFVSLLATLKARFADAGLKTRYYTPELHAAAFALPAFIAEVVEAGREEAGR